ncbi:MAG: ATP-binding protein [Opitutales bacterium]
MSLASSDFGTAQRVKALEAYGVMDTPPEEAFDSLTRLLGRLLDVPITLLSLLDAQRQWFKSRVGLEAAQTPLEISFCQYVVKSGRMQVVTDATKDPRFAQSPLVTGPPHIRFYAGVPLITPESVAVGTLCALDTRPREPDPKQLEAIQELAQHVVAQLELRKAFKKLKQQSRELKEASRAKTEFLATMSHEIRTPMNGVVGTADLLAEMPMPPEQKELVDFIRDSSDTMMGLLNDLLDFSKIETGRIELEMTNFDLGRMVRSAVSLFASQCEAQGLDLSLKLDGRTPETFYGDSARLRQVIVNLLNNALKFTESGSISVEVGLDAEAAALEVAVIDSGCGLSESARERLFTPFRQGDSSITRRYGGMGLGLSICRALVEAMGGDICLESTSDKGSRFAFHVPILQKPVTQPPEQAKPDRAPAQSGFWTKSPFQIESPSKPAMVLLVEDNAVNRKVAEVMLSRFGLATAAAVNGQEAVDMVQLQSYDLVLMDIQMPVMDGIEATREIRKVLERKCPPIIALTANAFAGDQHKFADAGMLGCLTKPLRPNDLIACLKEFLPAAKLKE